MDEQKSMRIFLRSVPIIVGLSCLAMCVIGSVNEVLLQIKGVKATGKVLALELDHKYVTTNYRRNEDFYRIQLEFWGPDGQKRTATVQVSPKELKNLDVSVGSLQSFIYIPDDDERARLSSQVLNTKELIVWNALFATFGLFLISWGIWGKLPSAK